MNIAAQTNALRALVVDDEAVIRRFIAKSLTNEGFTCDTAEDGEAAAKLAAEKSYDLVVTDLALPRRNGHSLATELLARTDRPVVVVLTGVLEPRLAKDLMTRGIDDILFKPVDFATSAAKMRSLVDRRRKTPNAPPPSNARRTPTPDKLPRVATDELESRLRGLSRVPTVSKAAIEVFKLTTNPNSEFREVAAAAQRDPALIVEILRLANSSFFNPSPRKIDNLDQAVVRIGQKQVGELALATAAFASVTQEKIPFFPLAYVWRDCLASGICLELLAEQAAGASADCRSLFCAAVLAPVGRIMLASLFPEIYETLLKKASEENLTLTELEAQVFPVSAGDVLAGALGSWGIPDEVHRPLRFSSKPFHALNSLEDSLRRRVALVKTAGLLGKLGAGQWETWDAVDLPAASVLKPLGIHAVDGILSQCRDELAAIASAAECDSASFANHRPPQISGSPTLLAYKRVQNETLDLLPHLFASAGIRLVHTAADVADVEGTVLINALDAAVPQIIARIRTSPSREILILADADNAGRLQSHGRVLSLPMSYGLLRKVCTPTAAPPVVSSQV